MRQKILKWMTAFSSCIVLLLLCGMHTQAVENINTDDSWVAGSTDEDEVNYYTFSIPSAGRVTVTYQSYMPGGTCDLYDKDLITYYKGAREDGSDVSPSTAQFSMDLEAGAYSLKLYGAWHGDEPQEASDYRVKLSFVPAGNNETEPNDNFGTAMTLANGTLVRGFLSADDKLDFYRVSIAEGTTIKTTVSRETLESYDFSVWNSDLVEVDRASWNRDQTYVWEQYLAPGTYYIKISDERNTGTYTLKWEGINYVEAVQLKKSELVLERKKSYSLLQSVLPENANNKNIQWTSDDTSVASVDSHGKVTARGIGTATIEAAAMDGSEVKAVCKVVVKPSRTQIIKCRKIKDRNVTVKVKAQKNVTGIQYQLSRNKNFKGKKSSYYAKEKETSATTAVLKKNKTYYFRARMYFDHGGKRYSGEWSKVKKIKTGKRTSRSGYFSWKGI